MSSKARDNADRVVGVDGREHQVAGERRLHRQVGGLAVADLADHDDVRVLAQRRAQPRSQRCSRSRAAPAIARRRGSYTRPGPQAKVRFASRGRLR
jgi:hypothetical protein